MNRPTHYKLTTVLNDTLTATSIDHLLFEEDPKNPFIRVLSDGSTSVPHLIEVVAIMEGGEEIVLAGDVAGNIRTVYAEWFLKSFTESEVIYEEQLEGFVDAFQGSAAIRAYLYETGGTLYRYPEVKCLMREHLDNIYSVSHTHQLAYLARTSTMPVGHRQDGDEVIEIPEGTYDEVVAGIRAHLEAAEGVTVLYPGDDIEVENYRDYGVIAEEGVDIEAVLAEYSHPLVEAMRIDLTQMVSACRPDNISIAG